jgi:hypothetical protein
LQASGGTSYKSFVMVALAMGGIILAAASMLWMLQRMMLGHRHRLRSVFFRISVFGRPPFWRLWRSSFVRPGLYPSPLMETVDVRVTALVHKMKDVAPVKFRGSIDMKNRRLCLSPLFRICFLALCVHLGSGAVFAAESAYRASHQEGVGTDE